MAGNERRSRDGDYRAARIAAALALVAAILLMITVDALSTEYEASPVLITILVAGILALVGLEAHDILRGGPT